MKTSIRYLVKIGNNPTQIFFEFHPRTKIIQGVQVIGEDVRLDQAKWLLVNAPATEGDLIENFAKVVGKKCSIQFAPIDVTFAMFWDRYQAKVGNKERAKKLWNLMNQHDQAAAYAYIETYNRYLFSNPTLTKAYPETYLSQRRWEN
jgi:hypothetical protein